MATLREFSILLLGRSFSAWFFFLVISEAPSEVQNLQGVATCKSITLTWLRPKDNGGMPINKYVVNYDNEKSVTRNVDGDQTSYTVDKLKQNTEYSFTLRATNRAEWGPLTSVKVKTTEYCKFCNIICGSIR